MNKLQELQNDIHQWADKTFGKERETISAAYHLKKEINELIESLESDRLDTDTPEEFADCFILILNTASKYGMTTHDLIRKSKWKMSKNKLRQWGKPDENGVVEHIRTEAS